MNLIHGNRKGSQNGDRVSRYSSLKGINTLLEYGTDLLWLLHEGKTKWERRYSNVSSMIMLISKDDSCSDCVKRIDREEMAKNSIMV